MRIVGSIHRKLTVPLPNKAHTYVILRVKSASVVTMVNIQHCYMLVIEVIIVVLNRCEVNASRLANEVYCNSPPLTQHYCY